MPCADGRTHSLHARAHSLTHAMASSLSAPPSQALQPPASPRSSRLLPSIQGFSQLPIWSLHEGPASHSLLVGASVRRPLGRPVRSFPETLSVWGPSQALLDGDDRNLSHLHREPLKWSVASGSELVTACSQVPGPQAAQPALQIHQV